MELNRDQLIDCVRRCNLNNVDETCKYCTNRYLSNWDLGGFNCHDDLANEVISRLEADEQKIKELTEEIEDLEADYDRVYEQAEADIRGNMADGGTSCHWCIDRHRAESIKEFAERLKKRLYGKPSLFTQQRYIVNDEIDNLAKEILEGKNNA